MVERPRGVRRLAGAFARARKRLRRPRFGGDGPVWSGGIWAMLLAGIALTYCATWVDEVAASFAHTSNAPWVRFLARLTDLGESQWYLIPAGLIVILLGLMDWGGRGTRFQARLYRLYGHAAYAFVAVALSGIITNIFKMFFGRARPVLLIDRGPFSFDPFSFGYEFASFPSGHSTTAGAVTALMLIWFPRWWPVLLPSGFVIAMTRIASRSHYPSDVVAGFFLGLIVAIVLGRWLASRRLLFRLSPGRLLPVLRGHGVR